MNQKDWRVSMTVQINDPWLEGIFKHEFNANPTALIETFKSLLSEKKERERRTAELLKYYAEARISTGEIARRLNLTRDEVLSLLQQNKIALVDYDFAEDEATLSKYVKNR